MTKNVTIQMFFLRKRFTFLNKNASVKKSICFYYIVSANCSSNWIQNNGSCYLKSSSSKTFDSAENECESKGANLSVINSDEEFNFIHELCVNNSLDKIWVRIKFHYFVFRKFHFQINIFIRLVQFHLHHKNFIG